MPYQGLQFFDVRDADRFFGRETLSAELVTLLSKQRFLAIVGASGSGKSSLVRAGIVPALQHNKPLANNAQPPAGSERWPVHIITPGAQPLENLAASLTRTSESVTATATLIDDLRRDARSLHLYVRRLLAQSGATTERLLLIVDQFEETFTLCRSKEERQTFIDNLLTAAVDDGATTVIITLRADFYAHCAESANLRAALEQYQRYIGPMTIDELRRAIEEPAQQGNWGFEPGLVDLMLEDVGNEPGALPLLSHALLETWERRRGRTLTFAGYTAAGRVQGAIAETANRVFSALGKEEQRVARNIFLRLTELGEGAQDTRCRVILDELIPTPAARPVVEKVLKTLADARLVTTFQAEAEVAHEALIREWPTLREWLDESREWLRIHHRLTEAAHEWMTQARAPDLLYRRTTLEQTVEKAKGHEDELNDLERNFLQSSQDAIAAEEARKAAAQQRELQQARTARNLATMALVAAVVALLLGSVVGWQLYAKNRELQGERLLSEARELKQDLEATAAIEKFQAADAAAKNAGVNLGIDVSAEISDTLRHVATELVLKGETLLRQTQEISSPSVRQQAVISATKLFAQAYALKPPPDTLLYVWVPSGELRMGSTVADLDFILQYVNEPEREKFEDEIPSHPVFVNGYWIMRTEVTNTQYAACIDAGVCDPPKNTRWKLPQFAKAPAINVSWTKAKKYAHWVGGRLPTEAEWEMACRGLDRRLYPWGNQPPTPELLNYPPSQLGIWTEVGSYPAGASFYGLLDMGGNAWEWAEDQYIAKPDNALFDSEPSQPAAEEEERVLRGGAFVRDHVHCANRDSQSPDDHGNAGFRVVIPDPLVEH